VLESEAKTNGFGFGLVQAVFSLWKREAKPQPSRLSDDDRRAAFMAGWRAYPEHDGDSQMDAAYVTWLAQRPEAQPLPAEARPTHTAKGEEIVGWTAPQPSRPIVIAKSVYRGDHDDSQPLAAIDHAQDGDA
jgi:hypothetical protein